MGRFDKFLDYVCGDIISDRERENARNELYDHLMCTYECNLAQGMDEEKATIEAENSMGDKNDVKTKLGQVHASFPELRFKSALALVIAGFFFASFQISLLSGMDILIKLFGQSLMIAGIFCLRKAHKKLGLSFAAIMGQYVLSGASTVLTPIAENHPLPIFILSLLGAICGAAFWILFVGGLIDLRPRGRRGSASPAVRCVERASQCAQRRDIHIYVHHKNDIPKLGKRADFLPYRDIAGYTQHDNHDSRSAAGK
mgnify:CR=1 FL=1